MASDWFKGQSSVVVLTLLISKSDNRVFCYLSLRYQINNIDLIVHIFHCNGKCVWIGTFFIHLIII